MTITVAALTMVPSNTHASWAEVGAQEYETVDYEVGVASAAQELCANEPVQLALFDRKTEDTRECIQRIRENLDTFFHKPDCREGGFYSVSLQCCLDAISGAFQDLHDRALDSNIIAPAWDDVLDTHCDPNDVCKMPSIPVRPNGF